MIRYKNRKNAKGINEDDHRNYIDIILKSIDISLQGGVYKYPVDVRPNGVDAGLLYISASGEQHYEQYNKTVEVYNELYLSQRYYNDLDTFNVLGINTKVYPSSDAIDVIWNHINNKKEPAAVVINSNNIDWARGNRSTFSNEVPTLHYNVIAGTRINEGVKEFYTFDPLKDYNKFWYPADKLLGLMKMPYNAPVWVYDYPRWFLQISEPCYILLVEGTGL
jgi:hypothetical protein